MPQLHRDDVLAGAIAILDEYGLADLTMRRLAGSLNVAPGALYWHFPNKQTLLGAIADTILAPLDVPARATAWDEQIVEVAHRLRDALLAHRDGAELVSATYASRLTSTHTREMFASAAIRAGLARADAELAAYTILYYVLGQTVDEQARMQWDSAGALTESASPLFEEPDASTRFEFGVRLVVGGIRHTLGDRARG